MAADCSGLVTPDQVSGLVLAGGRGRRMQRAGSEDAVEKGLMLLHGKPLISWALQNLPRGRAHTYISANRCHDKYASYGQVVSDDTALGEAVGPLHGVASVLPLCTTAWLMVVPVDVPLVPANLFKRLAQAAALAPQPKIVYVRTSERAQPLFMLIHVALLSDLRQYLLDGGRRVLDWQQVYGVAVDFSDASPDFLNINTRADLENAARIIPVAKSF